MGPDGFTLRAYQRLACAGGPFTGRTVETMRVTAALAVVARRSL